MKRKQSILTSLMALALVLGAGTAQDANADVRVNATFRTPNARVHIGNTPGNVHRVTRTQRTVVASHIYKVTRHDRDVAIRLSKYTGVPVSRMIQLKSAGYRWRQIARRLQLPRPAVRAAMSPQTWQRFVRRNGRFNRCGA